MASEMKILMLGNKYSGKTTYMASSYMSMKSKRYGFFIQGNSDTDALFRRINSDLEHGIYPAPSDKRQKYNFTLYHQGTPLIEYDWIDYHGGVISEMDANEFKKDLEDCDGLMVFLDADALSREDMSAVEMRRLLALTASRLQNTDELFTIIILLTKYDMVGNSVTMEELCHPLDAFTKMADANDHIYYRIVPVSCTRNGLVNVDLPILDMLHNGITLKYYTHAYTAKNLAEKAVEYNNKRGVLDYIVSRLTGQLTNGEISDRLRASAEEELAVCEKIKGPFDLLTEYINHYKIVIPTGGDPWSGRAKYDI